MIPLPLLTLLSLPACSDEPVDLDDSGDSGAPVDSGDSGGEERLGAGGRLGAATANADGYVGTEDWYFIADRGEGEELCRVQLSLASTAARADCADCAWAWDLEVTDAALLVEAAPGCTPTLGLDSADLSGLVGQTVSYGYAPDYFGHAQVLMVATGGAWAAATFATWDEDSGAFAYDWETGFYAY